MILELTEYEATPFGHHEISHEIEQALYRDHRNVIDVKAPSLQTEYRWLLTSLGWVGFIPLLPKVGVSLRPKTPIGNVFRMLEYAYMLDSFKLLDGTFRAATLEELYEQLANILAKRILDRGRKGFQRNYEPETDQLAFVRGRMDVGSAVRAPWKVNPTCHFEEHTADTEDNRILAWTMFAVARGGLCSERVLPTVRRAYRQLARTVTVEQQTARSCTGRHYTRLNDDYRPLHTLCRFFLDNMGPTHDAGDRAMIPFLVNMNWLFEKFVAEWMAKHLPERFELRAQEAVTVSDEAGLRFNLDLTLYDRETKAPVAVLDTKYKTAEAVGNPDFYQIVTYAKVKGAPLAVLIYPTQLAMPLDLKIGDTRVRGLTFPLAGDLEADGQAFLDRLLGCPEVEASTGAGIPLE